MGNYGEFEEVVDNGLPTVGQTEQIAPVRVRLPRKGEVMGIITQRYGGNRMDVKGTDGKSRNCRVTGRFKRDLWLRPKDTVLIVPWLDDDSKGDIVYKYNPFSVNLLKKKGLLNGLKEEF